MMWKKNTRAGLAAAAFALVVVGCSDMFFGSRHNLIMPGPARSMADGWETRRRRGGGHDWAIVRLGRPGRIRRVEVDTTHFKGNAPGRCSLEVCEADDVAPADMAAPAWSWRELLGPTRLQPHTRHLFEDELTPGPPASHVRLNIFPDGGVARLRVYGRLEA